MTPPGNSFDRLLSCAGTWRGESTLQDPGRTEPERTASSLSLAPVLGGRFARIDYTWSYHGEPQEGSLLVGFDPEAHVYSGHWIDTWHMSRKVMALEGTQQSDATINLRGSYAAPPGPDWGWRIVLKTGPQAFDLVMYNIWPEGEREDLAVEAGYTPVESAAAGA